MHKHGVFCPSALYTWYWKPFEGWHFYFQVGENNIEGYLKNVGWGNAVDWTGYDSPLFAVWHCCIIPYVMGVEKCLRNFRRRTVWKAGLSETQMLYGVILKRLLNRQTGTIWTAFLLIRIMTSGGLLCTRKWKFQVCKTQSRNRSDLRTSVAHGVIFPAVTF